jgi:glucokinase
MDESALAVDLGGTNIRAALVTDSGDIRSHVTGPTKAQGGVDVVIDRIVGLLEEVIAQEQVAPDVPVGVAAPGPLNPHTGVLLFAPNLPGFRDVPMRDILSDRLNRPVMIANDGNAAALGEFMFGAAQHRRHVIYVALGTGVGGGIVVDGCVIDGLHGLGGEVGHIPVDITGPRCHCGGVGCIEAYAGGWAIARDGEFLVRSERSVAIRQAAQDGPITAKVVAIAAREGDPAARAVFERAAQALGVGLAGLVNVFNPEIIVIGGGLARAGDLIFDTVNEAIATYAMRQISPDVSVVPSALGTRTGILGAAALAFHAGSLKSEA